MNRFLVLVVVCGLLGAAQAEIELCWSTTGLGNGALMYSGAQTNFLPIVPPTYVHQLAPGTHDLYLWGTFIETPTMPHDTQLYGLDLKFMGTATQSTNVAYRHNKTGAGPYLRWNTVAPVALDSVLAAVTARGVEFIVPANTNSDLYYPVTHEFLLGAARITGGPGDTTWMELETLSGAGIAMREIGGNDIVDPPVTWCGGMLTFTPEPGGLLLVLCGWLVGRRQG